jgi:hypothetical protein
MGKKRRPRKKPASSTSNSASNNIVSDRTKKNNANANSSTLPLPAVLQRLRHADAAIREATIHGLSSHKTTTLDYTILQELRNQVTNHSVSAATCLIPHLTNHNNDQQQRVASWWSTFHQVVTEELTKKKQQSSVAAAATAPAATRPKVNDEDALLLECLKCCTAMVENNPFVRHVEDAPDVFWEVLVLPPTPMTTMTTSTSSTIDECSTYAARILHAMSESQPQSLWCRTDHTTNLVFSMMMDATVRGLHLLGTAINCHVPNISYTAIPLALQSFTQLIPTLTNLCDVYERYAEAQQDSCMEEQVVQTQQAKREPARQIARRLKKEAAATAAAALLLSGADMPEDDDGEDGDEKKAPPPPKRSGKITADRTDTAAAWWNTVADWEERLEPVELALEILANMTLQQQQSDDDDDDAMMEQQQQQTIVIPDDTMSSLEQLLEQLHQVSSMMILPTVIRESIAATQNTAAVCTGNLLCSISIISTTTTDTTTTPHHDDDVIQSGRLWTLLQHLSPKTAPILSAQMLVLKTHGSLYRLDNIQPYLQLLLESSSTASSSIDEDIVREAIPLVSLVLTREPHDTVMNRAVAHALVHCPLSTGSVVTERLNALMDLYGDDDCHADIFDEMKLLDYVKSQRQVLKERINVGSLGGSTVVDEEEIASWKEAVANAAAFIEYKRDRRNGGSGDIMELE